MGEEVMSDGPLEEVLRLKGLIKDREPAANLDVDLDDLKERLAGLEAGTAKPDIVTRVLCSERNMQHFRGDSSKLEGCCLSAWSALKAGGLKDLDACQFLLSYLREPVRNGVWFGTDSGVREGSGALSYLLGEHFAGRGSANQVLDEFYQRKRLSRRA